MFANPAKHNAGRRGMTLIELLVVMAIMMILFGLTIRFLPSVYQDENVRLGGELLQRWLVTARERAKREKHPCGLRIIEDTSSKTAVDFQYIIKPEDGTLVGQGTGATIQVAAGTAAANDYVIPNGSGLAHRVIAGGGQLTLASPLSFPATQFRVLRSPRPLLSEPILKQPIGVGVDLKLCSSDAAGGKPAPVPLDILFSPSGAITGEGIGMDKIVLWVRELALSPTEGEGVLICIYTRTGFIAVHPADKTQKGNPYSMCLDPRSSGI